MVTTYKTEPLETYEWAKELRLRHFDEAMKAHEHGKLLIMGNMNAPKEIIAGIGDFVHLGGEPWGVYITREGGSKLLMECLEEVERRGYTRDMCAYMRASWGSMFL
ncbi:MAG: bzdO, partial [Dehalococcoidia bacterium]|nr:bzdO [Dehalococcoidia bacterium]